MSWGVITGDEQLVHNGMNNEVKFESGKPKKVRLLLNPGQEPYSFFQHTIEVEKVENGQSTRVFRTINCPKTQKNPNAPCKLCDGQQYKRRIRHAAPAFDYDEGTAKALCGGEKIFKPMAVLQKMGVDPCAVDWAVLKTGQTRNDTDYSVNNIGQTPFTLPAGIQIPNMEAEYRPHSEEEMKSIIESLGIDWNSVIVPPPIQYQNSLQEALDHKIPNTKYKDQTMGQVWQTNRGMIEYFANSNRVTPEKAAAQIILVALGGAQIDGVPNYAMGGTPVTPPSATQPATPQATQQAPATQPATTQTPPATQAAPVNGARQTKMNEINQLLQTKKKFIDGGYNVIIETMKQASGGKTSINEFSDPELDKMLEICKQA